MPFSRTASWIREEALNTSRTVLRVPRKERKVKEGSLDFDVVILGSGPAGLQAAVHAARTKVSVGVLGRSHKSALFKAHVENYCCLDSKLEGYEMLEEGKRQVKKAGAQFFEMDVVDLRREEDGRLVVTMESGEVLTAWSLIFAMGISRNRLNVKGEKELLGKGVSYCVDCDANFFRDQTVVVVGNESAAASGALALLLIAREVHLVCEKQSVSEHLGYQIERSSIQTHFGRKVKAVLGSSEVEAVLLDNDERIEASGIFIELGAKGALELATKLDVALDSNLQFIVANKKQEANIPGVYAAGDICGPPWQMAKAVGEGCVAGLEAAAYARKRRSATA
jgi:thioredoxin reductase (NADPH)